MRVGTSSTTRRPAATTPASGGDLLAGATIVTHDLAAGTTASHVQGTTGGMTGTAVSTDAGAPSSLGVPAAVGRTLAPDWQMLRIAGGGLLVVLCFALFGWQIWRGREPVAVAARPIVPGSGAQIKVQVAGAVLHPGVYPLTPGDRVEDAIQAAGGFAPGADTAQINLAQRVRDEQRIDVPLAPQPVIAAEQPAGEQRGEADAAPPAAEAPGSTVTQPARPAATPRPATAAGANTTERAARPTATQTTGGKVNVNTATAAQLEKLPGIGEVSARRIVAYRETNGRLTSLDDLRRAGISESIIRRAADYLLFD